MTERFLIRVLAAILAAPLVLVAQQPAPTKPPPPPSQPTEAAVTIRGAGGAPRLAVPDFLALGTDAETKAVAATIGEVLWKDLAFEREFDLIPRDTLRVDPGGRLDRVGAVRPLEGARRRGRGRSGRSARRPSGVVVQVRLFNVASQQAVFAKEYTGSSTNPRLFAHTISDEIHHQQRKLAGVARTRLAFSSDRDGERVRGTVARAARRRSTSPTTTARTRGGSRSTARSTSSRSGRPTARRSRTRRTGTTTCPTSSCRTSIRADRPRRRRAATTGSTISCRRGRRTDRESPS